MPSMGRTSRAAVAALVVLIADPAAAQQGWGQVPPRTAPGQAWRCGEKTYCTQMTSCAEAMFHFQQCGLARLDGDRDGVPCERLCGQSRSPRRR